MIAMFGRSSHQKLLVSFEAQLLVYQALQHQSEPHFDAGEHSANKCEI